MATLRCYTLNSPWTHLEPTVLHLQISTKIWLLYLSSIIKYHNMCAKIFGTSKNQQASLTQRPKTCQWGRVTTREKPEWETGLALNRSSWLDAAMAGIIANQWRICSKAKAALHLIILWQALQCIGPCWRPYPSSPIRLQSSAHLTKKTLPTL